MSTGRIGCGGGQPGRARAPSRAPEDARRTRFLYLGRCQLSVSIGRPTVSASRSRGSSDDGAGHDEPIGAERRSRGEARDQSLLDEVQHLVEVHLARVQVRIDGRLSPVGETAWSSHVFQLVSKRRRLLQSGRQGDLARCALPRHGGCSTNRRLGEARGHQYVPREWRPSSRTVGRTRHAGSAPTARDDPNVGHIVTSREPSFHDPELDWYTR